MRLLLHGENIVESRKELNRIKSCCAKGEIIFLDGERVTFSGLRQALETTSFFAPFRLIILEHFFSFPCSDKKLAYLARGEFSSHLVLWEAKEVSSHWLKKLGKTFQIRLFRPPPAVFRFLDNFSPKKKESTLLALERALSLSSPSLIFYLFARRIRHLLLLKLGQVPSGLSDWQLRKIKKQSHLFSLPFLKKIYKDLLLIDFTQKRGEGRFDLGGELQLLLAS